jgi:hypothetical protein
MSDAEKFEAQGRAHAALKRAKSNVATIRTKLLAYADRLQGEKSIARSMQFCSSRILPGKSCALRASTTSSGIDSITSFPVVGLFANRPTTSFPVPVSPWIRTAESTGATRVTSVINARNFMKRHALLLSHGPRETISGNWPFLKKWSTRHTQFVWISSVKSTVYFGTVGTAGVMKQEGAISQGAGSGLGRMREG